MIRKKFVFFLVCSLSGAVMAWGQEAISRTNRSILQPEMEAQLQPGDMNAPII